MKAREWQFDGLVGPTHNYAGLAMGNLAAAKNAGMVSNPRAAALQGLHKMRFVRNLGMQQAFLPPHYRPLVGELKRLGFTGGLSTMLDTAFKQAPGLLAALYSSSFMWAANAATITPSMDTNDGKLHLTTANLVSHYHRSVEPDFTRHSLDKIFHNQKLFLNHNALPPVDLFADEGAANHMRTCSDHGEDGFNFFVYGKSHEMTLSAKRYPARQQREASETIARLHQLDPERCFFLQQSPEAIDGGVFHNDVIAVNTTKLMIAHEQAFIPEHRENLCKFFRQHQEFKFFEVSTQDLSIADSVSTYLFNSQLLELPGGRMALVAPAECSNHAGVRGIVDQLTSAGLLHEAHYLDVHESMRNGGGPACLRLRIVLTPEQEGALHAGVVLTDDTYTQLVEWVTTHYRDRLEFKDLSDPQFVNELDAAYVALAALIGLPDLYDPWRGY